MVSESIVLFGEGKTEAIFLDHIKTIYEAHRHLKIKVDKGQGKSPKDVAERLVNTQLRVGNYDRSLLLIDSDIDHNLTSKYLSSHNITLVLSTPKCIEGLMLQILGKLPKGAAHSASKDLKSTFMRLLDTKEAGYAKKLAAKCPVFFSKELLDAKRRHIPELNAILEFLNV
jgi:hypothetical protein